MRKRRDYRPYSYDYDVMPLKTRYQMLLEKMQNIDVDVDTSKINVTAKINYDDLNNMIGKAIKDNPVNLDVPPAKIDPESLTSLRSLIVKSKCEVIENMSSNCGGKSSCCTGSNIPTDQLATKDDVKNAVCEIINSTDDKVTEIPSKVKEELKSDFQAVNNNVDVKTSEIPTKVKEELAPDFKAVTDNTNAKSNDIIAEVQIVKTELDNKLDKDTFKNEADSINTKLDGIDTEVKNKLDSSVYEAGVTLINETFAAIDKKIDKVDTKVQTIGVALVSDWGERLVNL